MPLRSPQCHMILFWYSLGFNKERLPLKTLNLLVFRNILLSTYKEVILKTENNISVDEIISARNKCARIIAVFGSRYLPIFERLETEIIERQKELQLLEKALLISATSGTQNGTQRGLKITNSLIIRELAVVPPGLEPGTN